MRRLAAKSWWGDETQLSQQDHTRLTPLNKTFMRSAPSAHERTAVRFAARRLVADEASRVLDIPLRTVKTNVLRGRKVERLWQCGRIMRGKRCKTGWTRARSALHRR